MKAIMYHYVRPIDPEWPYFRSLNLDNFIRQLDYFRENWGFVGRDEFLDSFSTGKPVSGVVLTFDDGFQDHYRYVFPYLRDHHLWGIFYPSTRHYQNRQLLDVHRIHLLLGKFGGKVIYDYLCRNIDDTMLDDANNISFKRQTYQYQQNDDATGEVKRILNYYISYKFRTTVIDQLCLRFFGSEHPYVDSFYLKEEQIVEMMQHGMLFGNHSHQHRLFSKYSEAEQDADIAVSFKILDEITGGLNPRSFCYPYGGAHSFNADTEKLLKKHGCLFSFNVEPRDITGDDLTITPLKLPRYDCNMFEHGKNTMPIEYQ